MMEDHPQFLTPKQAISAAFALFEEFFPKGAADHLLLEELEFDEKNGQWRVVIGFDTGRRKEGSAMFNSWDRTSEPIREFRTFIIRADDGSLVRMV